MRTSSTSQAILVRPTDPSTLDAFNMHKQSYEQAQTKQLMRVALGQEPADLVITNARLLNVYTGELQDHQSVAVKGRRIAYLGDHASHTLGNQTRIIDLKRHILIPGLIDGHTHLGWLIQAPKITPYALRHATTSMITETMEPYPIMGLRGVRVLLESFEDQPVNIYVTSPCMVSLCDALKGIPEDDLKQLLERNEILGLGESYWQGVVQEPDRYLPLFSQARQYGKTLEGHSAGASNQKLCAYIACGISSCHEPINATEALSRLRLGLRVMLREGSIRSDLEAISELKNSGISTRRLMLVTDGLEPLDLLERGYMDYLVQRAIECGFDPVEAIQMATLNPAEHFRLDHDIGAIAPGRLADMVVIAELEKIHPLMVFSRGRLVVENDQVLTIEKQFTYPPDCMQTISLPKTYAADHFSIQTPTFCREVRVNIIHQITGLVTQEISKIVPVEHGEIKSMPERDLIKVAAIDRAHNPGNMFVGLLHGWGLREGAMACSTAWDTSDIVVVGASDSDMAHAVNRIHEIQGGMVICRHHQIIAELPLPVFGLISDLPIPEFAEKTKQLRKAAADLGFVYPNPLLTLSTLTGAAIPFVRICNHGLIHIKTGRPLPLIE